MITESSNRYDKLLEVLAYLLAMGSFLVLFFEPIIEYYFNYNQVERIVVISNLLLLILIILNRVSKYSRIKETKVLIFDLVILLFGALLLITDFRLVIFILLIRQTYYTIEYVLFRAFEGKLVKFLISNPPITVMLSFIAVIGIGTILLMTPGASGNKQVTPFVNALFTATSATCVTGLVVYDTGAYFSRLGQLIILLLIQIGGLGIMTVSTAFALILGQRITLKLENVMHKVVGGATRINLFQLLKSIVLVTLVIEFVGAVILYNTFSLHMSVEEAVWHSVFHSVSAFCNAGFSLFSDSFVGYSDNINVNVVVPLLIIIGGLGFAVVIDIYQYFFGKARFKRLMLHTKIVLITTAFLLGVGFVSFFISEYNHGMKGFSFVQRVLSSWFQSVTTRTAGFNTINIGGLSSASILITIVLMFIGASPGSTGGGIKTSTFAILVLSVTSMLKGKKDLSIFNRKIPVFSIREVTSLIALSVSIVMLAAFIMLLFEPHHIEQVVFEVVSAFGTVGLSTGITPELSMVGRILITLLMYIGRIGPLTLIYAIAIRRESTRISYAEEKVVIG